MMHTVSGVGFPLDLDVTLETILEKGLDSGFQTRLFFQTLEHRVGYVRKDGDGITDKTVQDQNQKRSILVLFDALTKQIRTGYFSIPNALLVTGGSR